MLNFFFFVGRQQAFTNCIYYSWLYHFAETLVNELNKLLAHAHYNLNEGHIFFNILQIHIDSGVASLC